MRYGGLVRRTRACVAALLLGLMAFIATPGGVAAQDAIAGPRVDMEAAATVGFDEAHWQEQAQRAENLIDAGVASTAFFESLRADLAQWRDILIAAQDANADRIATLADQVEALGAAPAEGETEGAPFSERRVELTEQLAEAQLPVLNATEGTLRVEGLIREVDAILGDRQQRELLERDPTPLNPVHWTEATGDLFTALGTLAAEVEENLAEGDERLLVVENAALIIGLLVFGVLTLWRGRRWTSLLTERLQVNAQRRGGAAAAFFVSLSQIAVPTIGILVIMAAVRFSGLLGPNGTTMIEAAAGLVVAALMGYWLGGRLFPSGRGPLGITDYPPEVKKKARNIFVQIGALVGLGAVILTFSSLNEISPASRSVITLPLFIILAFVFFRLARIMRAGREEHGVEDASGFATWMLGLLEKALKAVAVLGPVLALIGYTNAAQALMLPAALSLGIFGVLAALQPVIRDIHALVFKTTQEAADEALLPVIVNAVLIFAALPLLALSWGMRPALLGEIYTRFWLGFSIGGIEITPGTVVAIVAVFAIGMILTRLIQRALRATVLPRTKLDTGARNAVTSGVGYVGVALAAIIAVTAAGIDLTALGFVLGALSVGIGFGLQNVVSNFVSGIILLIERPISEGDWIEVNGNTGIVQAISVRSTRILKFDKTDVIVPNADFISGTVTNWTRGNSIGRAMVTVGVAYGTDTRRVHEILLDIARGHPDITDFPEPGVDFLGFGADSLDFRIRGILPDVNKKILVETELNHRITERFAEEGIEIPFAQRDVWLRNPELLPGAAPARPATVADQVAEAEAEADVAADASAPDAADAEAPPDPEKPDGAP